MNQYESDNILKTYENLEETRGNIWPRVQAMSPKVYIGVLLSIHKQIKHILKVCNVVILDQIDEKMSKLQTFVNS